MIGFPTPERISALLLPFEEFLYYSRQTVILWRNLLGLLSSLGLIVPRGCLRVRSLQLVLRSSWGFQDESVLIAWTPSVLNDLQC